MPHILTPDDLVNDTAVVIGSFKSGSDEWHAARANGLGGSEISAAVGLNQYESRFSLYYRKKDQLRPVEESNPMKWGTLLEPVIYDDFVANELKPGLHMTTGDTFHHIDRPYQIANPDGLMWNGDEVVDLLEIKTAGRDEYWGKDGSDIIPMAYRCQMAWYMDVLSLRSGILRVLIGGNDPRTYRITPSLEDIEFLRDEGTQFMYELQNDIAPDLGVHSATYQALKEMHPLIDGSVRQIGTDLADRWWAGKEKKAQDDAEWQGLVNEMAAVMGLAKIAMCGDEKVAYRQRSAYGAGEPYVKSAARLNLNTSIVDAA